MAQSRKCKVRGCKNDSRARGLCVSCYGSANRMVHLGETSWEEMEQQGMVSRKQKSKFREAVEANKSQ